MNRRFFSLLIVFLASAQAFASSAGFYSTQNKETVRWFKIPIQLCLNKSLPREYKKNVDDAAAIWNKSFSQKLIETNCKSKTTLTNLDKTTDHSLFWVTKSFEKYTDKTALARTLYSFDEKTAQMLDADIVINADAYNWKKDNIDLTTVLVHEMGHALGLKHNFIFPKSVMNYYPYVGGFQKRELDPIDISLINKIYFSDEGEIPSYFSKWSEGDSDASIKELLSKKEVLDANEDYALAVMYQAKKDDDSSLKYINDYLKNNPKDFLALYKRGELYWNKEKTEEAIKDFKQVLELFPTHYESLVNLAVIYLKKNMKNEATQNLKKALSIQPTHYLACEVLYSLVNEKRYSACAKKYAPKEKP